MAEELTKLIEKQLAQREEDLFQKIIDSGKATPCFVFIANPSCKKIIAEMKTSGLEVYCLFSSYVEKDKIYLVTDKELEDRIKENLK